MSASAPANPRRAVVVLVLALIADMLAFTCILPLFPSIVNFYSHQPQRDSLYDWIVMLLDWFQRLIGAPPNQRYTNAFFGGLLGSLFSALQFMSSPTLGALSDCYGRRAILLMSSLGSLISYLVWLRASTFSLFVFSRIIGGLSKANVNVATAIVSDVYDAKDHPKGMALIGMSYSVGFLVGPMIGAYFSTIAPKDSHYTTPAYFAIILALIQLLIVYISFPETLNFKEKKQLAVVGSKAKELMNPGDLFKFSAVDAPEDKKQQMQKIGVIYFIYLFLYSGLEFTLSFLTHIRFDFSSMQQGKLYLFTGLLMLPIQGHYVRRTPMHKQKSVAEFGILCIIPAFLLCAVAHNLYMLCAGLCLYAIASATVVTCLTSCVISIHPSGDKGALSGVFRSIGALSRALGPISAASIFWLFGPTMCYTIGAVLLVTPLILLRRFENPIKQE